MAGSVLLRVIVPLTLKLIVLSVAAPMKQSAPPSPALPPPRKEQIPFVEVELVAPPIAASPPPQSRERNPVASRPKPPTPPQARRIEEEEPARLMGLSPREMLILALGLLGVFGLGVLALLGWLAYRLFG